VQAPIASQAQRLSAVHSVRIRGVFEIDRKGRIPELAGVDPTVPGAPTIADVAARLPRYQGRLTTNQISTMQRLRDDLAPFREVLEREGIDLGYRTDIIPGDFYVPRGNTTLQGVEEVTKIRGRGGVGGKRGFQRPAPFSSQAQGIDAGFVYPELADVLLTHARGAGTLAADVHVATFLKAAVDPETGLVFASTAASRVDPVLRAAVTTLRTKIQGRTATLLRQQTRGRAEQRAAIEARATVARSTGQRSRAFNRLEELTDVSGRPLAGDMDDAIRQIDGELVALRQVIRGEIRPARVATVRGARTALRRSATDSALDAMENDLRDIRVKWKDRKSVV